MLFRSIIKAAVRDDRLEVRGSDYMYVVYKIKTPVKVPTGPSATTARVTPTQESRGNDNKAFAIFEKQIGLIFGHAMLWWMKEVK